MESGKSYGPCSTVRSSGGGGVNGREGEGGVGEGEVKEGGVGQEEEDGG